MDVLVVEDDPQLSQLLRKVIREEGATVEHCGTAGEGRAAALEAVYDVIVLDWMLPDGDGVELCMDLRASGVQTPILMLTARGEVSDRVKGLRCGADDYLTKPFEIDEFLARLNALVRRSQRGVIRIGGLSVDRNQRRVLVGDHQLDLTAKEFDLLLHMAVRRGQTVPRAELLKRVWNLRFDPGSGLLDVHISRLRDKLAEHADVVETVRGVGYRIRAEP